MTISTVVDEDAAITEKSTQTAFQRNKWVKGQSGNPLGQNLKGTHHRHKVIQEALNACYDSKEVTDLLDQMRKLGMKGNTRAALIYLEYVAGKPTQPIDIKGDTPNATQTLDRMTELIRQYPQLIERMLPEGMRVVKSIDASVD